MLISLNHEEPDRVPRFLFYTPEVQSKICSILNIDVVDNPYLFDIEVENDLMLCYRGISNIPGVYQEKYIGDKKLVFKDVWGIEYRKVDYGKGEGRGSYVDMISHPLSDIKKYDTYKFPDPLTNEDYEAHKILIEKYGKDYGIIAGVATTVLEASWYLRGLDNLLMDMMTNDDFVIDLMQKCADYHLVVAKEMVKIGADIIWFGDDVGMQEGMLISPEQYRKFLKPIYANLIQEIKKVDKNIKVAYHTDGYVEPVIPDFIEIGIDILQVIQPACMDPGKLKKKFGENLSFWGSVDVQYVMPFGTAGEVVNEVRERIRTVAPGGGFILCPSHCVQPSDRDVSNVFTYYWAADKYGNYPIRF